MKEEKQKRIELSNTYLKENKKGITLIALIITIIVMLILVAIVVRTAINSGLFKHAGEATKKWSDAQRGEMTISDNVDRKIAEINGEWHFEETFTSPNYPENYPNNTRIAEERNYGADVTGIKFVFVDVNLEPGACYDYIEVFAGSPETSPLMVRIGDGATGEFIAKTHCFNLRFITDYRDTFRGYRIDVYTTTDKDLLGEHVNWKPSTDETPSTSE